MKRLIAIGLSVLMLVGFSADAVAMSDSDKKKYLAWIKEDRSQAAALAIDASEAIVQNVTAVYSSRTLASTIAHGACCLKRQNQTTCQSAQEDSTHG